MPLGICTLSDRPLSALCQPVTGGTNGNASGAGFNVTVTGASGAANATANALGAGFGINITGATGTASSAANGNATGLGFGITISGATATASGTANAAASGAGFNVTIGGATGSANSTANAQGAGFAINLAGATGTATGTSGSVDGVGSGGGFGINVIGANGNGFGVGGQADGIGGGGYYQYFRRFINARKQKALDEQTRDVDKEGKARKQITANEAKRRKDERKKLIRQGIDKAYSNVRSSQKDLYDAEMKLKEMQLSNDEANRRLIMYLEAQEAEALEEEAIIKMLMELI